MDNLANDPLFDPIDDIFPDEDTYDTPETPPQKTHKKTSFAPPPRMKRKPVYREPPRSTRTIPDDDDDYDEEIENFDGDGDSASLAEIFDFLKSMSVFLILIFAATFVCIHKKFKDFVMGYIPEATENTTMQSLIISGSVTSLIAIAFVLNKLKIISF
jgi:hypothetical protein